MEIYKKVKFVQSILNSCLKNADGIRWGNVLTLEIWRMCSSKFNLVKLLAGTLLYEFNMLSFLSAKSDILIEYSIKQWNRKDYDAIIQKLESELLHYDKLIVNDKVLKYTNLFKIFLIMYYFFKIRKLSVREKFIAANLVARRKGLVPKIKRLLKNNKYKLVITFCDAHITSNLVAQVANQMGITTVTLQHGQYVYYEPGTEVVHCETYENFISDYMLVWGQYTIDELSKAGIDSKRLLISGSLKENTIPIVKLDEVKKTFGVVLSNAAMTDSNIRLIQIANEIAEALKYKYIIRAHPLDNINKYNEYINSDLLLLPMHRKLPFESYVSKVDFNIIHLSSVYLELLEIGSPVFVYVDEFNKGKLGEYNEIFESIDEFFKKFAVFQKDPFAWQKSMLNKHNYYVEKDGPRLYRERIYTLRLLSIYKERRDSYK